jgi:hypothetical protein
LSEASTLKYEYFFKSTFSQFHNVFKHRHPTHLNKSPAEEVAISESSESGSSSFILSSKNRTWTISSFTARTKYFGELTHPSATTVSSVRNTILRHRPSSSIHSTGSTTLIQNIDGNKRGMEKSQSGSYTRYSSLVVSSWNGRGFCRRTARSVCVAN